MDYITAKLFCWCGSHRYGGVTKTRLFETLRVFLFQRLVKKVRTYPLKVQAFLKGEIK